MAEDSSPPGTDDSNGSAADADEDDAADATELSDRPQFVSDATVRTDEGGRREVELPLRLYKTVTVFSTLIAVVCVVLGFLLLDAATLGGSLLRRAVASVLSALGVAPADGTLSALFAVAGLLTIGFGAAVYVLGTRFRAPGMTGERDADEE